MRELKEILAANFVDFKGCVEKNELIEKVRRLYRDRQNEKAKGNHLLRRSPTSAPSFILAKELDSATASDSELCKVCMDAIADCVFLDCGHMVSEELSPSPRYSADQSDVGSVIALEDRFTRLLEEHGFRRQSD